MDIVNLGRSRRFLGARAIRVGLFDRPNLVCDLICLEPRQVEMRRPQAASDELYVVVEGKARLRVGLRRLDLEELDSVIVPPGLERSIENEGPDRLTALVVLAPNPLFQRRPAGRPRPEKRPRPRPEGRGGMEERPVRPARPGPLRRAPMGRTPARSPGAAPRPKGRSSGPPTEGRRAAAEAPRREEGARPRRPAGPAAAPSRPPGRPPAGAAGRPAARRRPRKGPSGRQGPGRSASRTSRPRRPPSR